MAYFAVDKKTVDEKNNEKWKFAGFITAKNFEEAHNKIDGATDTYKLYVGYAIHK